MTLTVLVNINYSGLFVLSKIFAVQASKYLWHVDADIALNYR